MVLFMTNAHTAVEYTPISPPWITLLSTVAWFAVILTGFNQFVLIILKPWTVTPAAAKFTVLLEPPIVMVVLSGFSPMRMTPALLRLTLTPYTPFSTNMLPLKATMLIPFDMVLYGLASDPFPLVSFHRLVETYMLAVMAVRTSKESDIVPMVSVALTVVLVVAADVSEMVRISPS